MCRLCWGQSLEGRLHDKQLSKKAIPSLLWQTEQEQKQVPQRVQEPGPGEGFLRAMGRVGSKRDRIPLCHIHGKVGCWLFITATSKRAQRPVWVKMLPLLRCP